MTIATSQTEAEIIEAETALRAQRDTIDATLRDHARERRRTARHIDASIASKLNRTYQGSLAAVEDTRARIEGREATIAELIERQKVGDRSVRASDIRTEKDEVESLTNFLVADKANLREAEAAWVPYAADNHLAEFGADVLERVLDVPVLIRTEPDLAPHITPSIILSQRTATKDYGTESPSGQVSMRVVGDVEIDWRVVELAFEDTGSEVAASCDQITFHHLAFPLPVLKAPSPAEVEKWANMFCQGWHLHVERHADYDRLRALGYSLNSETGLIGHSDIRSTDLVADDGVATGTAMLSVATTESITVQELMVKVEGLVGDFAAENVGVHTAAGKLVNITVTSMDAGDRFQWGGYRIGAQTVDLTVQLDFRYATPTTEIADD